MRMPYRSLSLSIPWGIIREFRSSRWAQVDGGIGESCRIVFHIHDTPKHALVGGVISLYQYLYEYERRKATNEIIVQGINLPFVDRVLSSAFISCRRMSISALGPTRPMVWSKTIQTDTTTPPAPKSHGFPSSARPHDPWRGSFCTDQIEESQFRCLRPPIHSLHRSMKWRVAGARVCVCPSPLPRLARIAHIQFKLKQPWAGGSLVRVCLFVCLGLGPHAPMPHGQARRTGACQLLAAESWIRLFFKPHGAGCC